MKKFLPLLSVSLLLASVVSAQGLRYGVTGAMNASNFAMELNDLSFNPDMRIGFRAGFRVEMPAPFIYDGFYFDGELLLSSKGAKIDTTVGEQSADSTVRPYYLELPIHIGYRYDFGGGNVGIFGSFGPYVAMGLFGTDKVTVGSTSTNPDTFSDERLKRFDFGLGLRAGVAMFDHYRIFVGYDWGLINIAQDSDNKVNNRNFYVGASYMF